MPDPDLLVPALAALAVLSPSRCWSATAAAPSRRRRRRPARCGTPPCRRPPPPPCCCSACSRWRCGSSSTSRSAARSAPAAAHSPACRSRRRWRSSSCTPSASSPTPGPPATCAPPWTTRTAADVAPRRLRRTTSAWAAGLGVVLLVGTLTATGPRHLDRTVDGWISRGGPYPGTWYAVPLTIGAVLVLLATWGVLHLVATRPAVSGVDPAWDHALRCSTGARVLRGVQLALALTLGGMLVVPAWGVQGAAQPMPALGPHTASPVLGVVGAVLGILAVAVCVAGVVLALPRGAARPAATLTEAPA